MSTLFSVSPGANSRTPDRAAKSAPGTASPIPVASYLTLTGLPLAGDRVTLKRKTPDPSSPLTGSTERPGSGALSLILTEAQLPGGGDINTFSFELPVSCSSTFSMNSSSSSGRAITGISAVRERAGKNTLPPNGV